jgi:hypothetical protein
MVTVFDKVMEPVVVLVLLPPFVFVSSHGQVYITGNAQKEVKIDGKRLPSQGPTVSIPEAGDLDADHQCVLVQ